MKYRELGKTGMMLSEIGLGCEGFVDADDRLSDEMFAYALGNGVNCLDLYSPDPAAHRRIGRAMAPIRDTFYLQAHFCTAWKNGQYTAVRDLPQVKAAFDKTLQNLGTDYLDIGNIHYVDSKETWDLLLRNGVMDFAQEMKRQGRVRAVGLSSHNPIVAAIWTRCFSASTPAMTCCPETRT